MFSHACLEACVLFIPAIQWRVWTSIGITFCPDAIIAGPQGMIEPEVPAGTAASVFAIFDEGKKLQFVGFSKDLRNSLRTVFSRRPDKAFFYK